MVRPLKKTLFLCASSPRDNPVCPGYIEVTSMYPVFASVLGFDIPWVNVTNCILVCCISNILKIFNLWNIPLDGNKRTSIVNNVRLIKINRGYLCIEIFLRKPQKKVKGRPLRNFFICCPGKKHYILLKMKYPNSNLHIDFVVG